MQFQSVGSKQRARFHNYVKLGRKALLILYGVLLSCILLHNLYIHNKSMLSFFNYLDTRLIRRYFTVLNTWVGIQTYISKRKLCYWLHTEVTWRLMLSVAL